MNPFDWRNNPPQIDLSDLRLASQKSVVATRTVERTRDLEQKKHGGAYSKAVPSKGEQA